MSGPATGSVAVAGGVAMVLSFAPLLMFPNSSVNNGKYIVRSRIKPLTYFLKEKVSFSSYFSYIINVGGGKFCMPAIFAAKILYAALLFAVLNIVIRCTKKEMGWINAFWDIASMAHKEIVYNGSPIQFVRHAMCRINAFFMFDEAIPFTAHGTRPNPAPIRLNTDVTHEPFHHAFLSLVPFISAHATHSKEGIQRICGFSKIQAVRRRL